MEIKSISKGKSDSIMKKNSSGPSTKGGKNNFEIHLKWKMNFEIESA